MRDENKTKKQLIDELRSLRRHVARLKKQEIEGEHLREEQVKLVHELESELASIKILRGLLPICSSCKNIRDDKGDWKGLETYLLEHSEAEFTHGLCPECIEKLYPVTILKKGEQGRLT